MVIWTTTPWTMPANVAVALNPALEYAWVECEGEVLFMAKDLLAQVGAVCHKDLSNVLGTTLGKIWNSLNACIRSLNTTTAVLS